jgi:hypothetical protein
MAVKGSPTYEHSIEEINVDTPTIHHKVDCLLINETQLFSFGLIPSKEVV